MSDRYKQGEAHLAKLKKEWRANGYKLKEIRAMEGGWEWAMEQMVDFKTDTYAISKMHGDGSDAAGDLADSMVACGDIKPREKESYADTVYNGISAARKYVRETYGGED